MVICLERGADLHMAQLMPLSLAPVKSRLVVPFWYRLTQVVLEKRPLNGCSSRTAHNLFACQMSKPCSSIVIHYTDIFNGFSFFSFYYFYC